jgi:ABC-type branched-subunit amino acid transport system permease subunit
VITGPGPAERVTARARTILSPKAAVRGSRRPGTWALLVVLAAGLAFPFLSAGSAYNLQLAGDALALGTWVMGLDILVGYTGLVSFGHAAWLALGAYTFGYLAQRGWDAVPAIAVTIAVTAAAAWLLGIVATRAGGLAFAIITLAEGVVLYTVIINLGFVGGGVGLSGVPLPTIAGLSLLSSEQSLYFFALALALVSYLALRALVAWPVGGFWQAIRDDRVRAQSIGIELRRYEVLAFVVAAVIGAIGGVAFVTLNAGIGPSQFGWTESGLALVILIIGGSGTIYGAVIGAFIYVFASNYLTSSFASTWQVYFGVLFVALVLVLPGGVAGMIRLAAGPLRRPTA